jgi:hypothetical protein
MAIVAAMFVASFAIAQTPQENAETDLKQADAVAKRHRDELMKIPHVRVVTGEVDARSDAAILVEIDDQKNYDSVARQVPSQIEGFPVEIEEPAETTRTWPDPRRFPTVDAGGHYHHVFLQQASPAPTGAPQ